MEPPFILALPKEIMAVADRFSYRTYMLTQVVCRANGVYHWKDATAEVTQGYLGGNNLNTDICIEGKSLESISELYTMICGGLIHPTVSYNAPMSPSPARNIRQLFHEIGAVIRRNMIVWWSQKFHK